MQSFNGPKESLKKLKTREKETAEAPVRMIHFFCHK